METDSSDKSTSDLSLLSKETFILFMTTFYMALVFAMNESFGALYLDLFFNWTESVVSLLFLSTSFIGMVALIISFVINGKLNEYVIVCLFSGGQVLASGLLIGLPYSEKKIALCLFIVSFAVQIFCMGMILPFVHTLIKYHSPSDQVGLGLGIGNSCFMLGLLIGPILGSMCVHNFLALGGILGSYGLFLFVGLVLIFKKYFRGG